MRDLSMNGMAMMRQERRIVWLYRRGLKVTTARPKVTESTVGIEGLGISIKKSGLCCDFCLIRCRSQHEVILVYIPSILKVSIMQCVGPKNLKQPLKTGRYQSILSELYFQYQRRETV